MKGIYLINEKEGCNEIMNIDNDSFFKFRVNFREYYKLILDSAY
jgi:hypothetical protein